MVVPLPPQSEIVIFQNGLVDATQLIRLSDGVWEHVPICVSLHKSTPLSHHHKLCTSWSKLKDVVDNWQKQTNPKPLIVVIYGPWMSARTALDHIALNFLFDGLWKWLDDHVEHTIHFAIDGKTAPEWVHNTHPLRFELQ